MLSKKLALFALLIAGIAPGASKNLEIYWIDAEGGAATLIVSPSGESLLVDTANRTPDDRPVFFEQLYRVCVRQLSKGKPGSPSRGWWREAGGCEELKLRTERGQPDDPGLDPE